MTEEVGKIGTKGELYPSAKLRRQLNLLPNTKVLFKISPDGYLIVEPIPTIEDLLDAPKLAKTSFEETEATSEEMQNAGQENND